MTKKEQAFVAVVRAHYASFGRRTLPWRKTKNPYRILVSEVMLQQTQVERVIPKYQAFLAQFPTVAALAAAPLGAVLIVWQGLGYNRRAKMLHACAQVIVTEQGGRFPRDYSKLLALPGVGPYTAAAVAAFAFNQAVPLIETNVRTVYLHHFYPDATRVPDSMLWPHIIATLDQHDPRTWYAALMDYGTHLKRTVGNKNVNSQHYTKQSAFAGSDRQIRGAIIKVLGAAVGALTLNQLIDACQTLSPARITDQLARLEVEGLVEKTRGRFRLPT